MRGHLIVLEGLDGSGKTTQCKLLADKLRYRLGQDSVVTTREPGGNTPFNSDIRELIMRGHDVSAAKTTLLLLTASLHQNVHTTIKPALQEGKVVICDRFTHSGLVYQGYGKGLGLDLVRQLNNIACEGLQPGLVIWLDTSSKTCYNRLADKADTNALDRQDLAWLGFLDASYGNVLGCDESCVRIDGDLDKATVASQILAAVLKYLDSEKYFSNKVVN